jgi:imidazolonepropionase-like amidohydrolase
VATGLTITADRVWDGLSASPIEQGFVSVDEGRIVSVGRQADLGSDDGGPRRVDLPGATLLPGLINAHVHLTLSASATPIDDYISEAREGIATLTLRAVSNLTAAVQAGVTTVRDLGTINEVAFAIRDATEGGQFVGPRVVTSGRPITVTGGHCHWFSHECDSPREVRSAVRRQVKEGADLIKIFATGGNLTPRTNPFEPQFSEEELAACVDESRRLGVPVAAHAHAPEGIRRSAVARVSTIEHCIFETAQGVDYSPATADMMAAAGIAFVPTLGVSIRRYADPLLERPPVVQRFMAKAPLMMDALQRLFRAGAPLLAGSDAGIPFRGFGDFPADVGMLSLQNELGFGLGLPARVALTAATSGAAALIGLGDTGVLAPGRRADLLAVDGDPLTNIDDLARTRFVMANGRVVAIPDSGTRHD